MRSWRMPQDCLCIGVDSTLMLVRMEIVLWVQVLWNGSGWVPREAWNKRRVYIVVMVHGRAWGTVHGVSQ